ncbi:MAG: hypothetical protein MMC33_010759 [Icmadophila ericetorum]|nr:hypothetical protein [Icmadophila ericetorum]
MPSKSQTSKPKPASSEIHGATDTASLEISATITSVPIVRPTLKVKFRGTTGPIKDPSAKPTSKSSEENIKENEMIQRWQEAVLRECFTTMANGRQYCIGLASKHAEELAARLKGKEVHLGSRYIMGEYEDAHRLTQMRRAGIIKTDEKTEEAKKRNWEGYELWQRCWFYV